jgi:hypothetical protein
MVDKIVYEKNPKCKVCGKEINTDRDMFLMVRDKDRKDEYSHFDCYQKGTMKELKRIVNLGFKDWKSPI